MYTLKDLLKTVIEESEICPADIKLDTEQDIIKVLADYPALLDLPIETYWEEGEFNYEVVFSIASASVALARGKTETITLRLGE